MSVFFGDILDLIQFHLKKMKMGLILIDNRLQSS